MLKNSARGALNNLDSLPSAMPTADYDELVESLKKLAAVKKVEKFSIVKNKNGSGGYLKYNKVLSRKMLKQEQAMSCSAACIRQLAKDANISLTESAVRKLSNTSEIGTTDTAIDSALRQIFGDDRVVSKTFFRNDEELIPSIVVEVTNEGSWIANIHPPDGLKHSVIIDKVEGGQVFIRDPWPIEGITNGINGVEATVDLEKFSYSWLRGGAVSFQIK